MLAVSRDRCSAPLAQGRGFSWSSPARLPWDAVPYLQFDLPTECTAETKRRLAERVGHLYAEVMQTTPTIVKIAFRALGADSLFRCTDGAPEPVVVVMCDIRRGRPAEQRAQLAAALV